MHRALSDVLGPGTRSADTLCFASAGNTTERHWGGHFHDGGAGWHQWKDKQADNPLRPWGDDEVYVGGTQLLRSTDGGASFTPVTLPMTGMIRAIWAASANEVYVAGDGGIVRGRR